MYSLTLQNAAGDSVITSGDILGRVNFAVPAESDGLSATYIASFISCNSEGSFTSSSNPAGLIFATSDVDAAPATGRLRLSADGHLLPLLSNIYNLGSLSNVFNYLYINSGIFSSGLNIGNETANTIASFDSNKNIVSLPTATYPSLTELSYVKGLTSSIQTQINNKANTDQTMFIGTTSVTINRTSAAQTLSGVSINGNSATATTLATGRNINGTSFNGSANITTSSWGTARNITIGNTTRSVNGSTTYSWTLSDIGAQAALTNPVTGTGTSNFLPKWSTSSLLDNSIIYDNGTNVGIGTSSPSFLLDVKGSFRANDVVTLGSGSIPLPRRPIEILNDTNIDQQLSIRLRKNSQGNWVSGYSFPTVAGLSGQALVADSSGVVSWSDVILGSGISNYVPKWINSTTLTSGLIYDDGNHIGIGNNPNGHLDSFSTYGPSLVLGNGSGDVGQFFYSTNNASIWFTNGTELNNLRGQITYLHSEDKLAFGTSGVGISMALDANGNLGIGQNYPSARLNVEGGNIVFNDLGGNFDFRVEGDTDQNLLFTDASADSVGIGTNAPAAPLHLVRPKNATYGSFFIQDSTPMAQNVGGSIVFGGRYTSGGADARFGQIAALKANSTDGDSQSVLSFITNDGSSFTEKMRILPSGNVAIGSTGADSHRFSVRGNINANNAIGIYSDTAYGSAATSGTIYNVYSRGQINAYTSQNHYHFFTSSPALTNGATVNNELCYTATHTATGVVSQRGFYSTINGDSSWQLYMGGTAPSFINGNLGIGISNPSNKLQVENGNVVFNSAAGNYDFTVGGDTDVHTLCVDASADAVGIGLNTPLSTLHIEKNGVTSLRLQRSAPVGTSAVPVERSHIVFPNYNNVYDHIKLISWGRESNFLAGMLGINISNSAGVSSEVLTIDNQSTAGTFGLRTYNIPLVTTSGNVIFNETAGNFDFRAEGLSDPNLLFVDASADRVGIGTSSPTHKLHVAGSGYMDWVQLHSNYYINYPIPGSIAGNSNRDQIILFAQNGVATLFRGYIDSNSTATSNEYLRNFSRTFIHYRTSATVDTVPQVTVNGVYNGSQSDLAANDNGRVVKVLHNGIEYWGLIMQDLTAFQNPGAPVFNGYASSLANLQYGHRDGFTTVTDITPNTTAGRSASLFRYQNLSVPDGNVGVGTNNPTSRLHVEGGNVVFNDAGGNFDFRVEGDTDANLLFVDASVDDVGIGTNTPAAKLHIAGDALFENLSYRRFTASTAQGSHFRKYTDIRHYANSENTIAGSLRVEIPITTATMWSMGLVIVEYDGSNSTSAKTTHLTITSHSTTNVNTSVLTNNPSRINQVRFGRNLANTRTVVLIDPVSSFRYPKAYIQEIITHHNNDNNCGNSANYNITITTDETDFTPAVTVTNNEFIRDNKLVNTFDNQTITGNKTFDGNVVINETGGNFDFRVEGDTDPNLLFVDASNDSINIGTDSSTGSKLYVSTNSATNYSSILASGAAGSQSSLIRISNINNSINDSLAGLFISVKQPSTSTDQSAFISCLSSTEHVHTPHIVFGSRSGPSTFQELMRISSSGNFGIGTSSPAYKLDVVGTGNFSQNLLVNGTAVSVSGHTHTSSNITDFSTSVSGLLPVKNIVAGSNITISSTSGVFTINSTASGGTTETIHPFLLGGM